MLYERSSAFFDYGGNMAETKTYAQQQTIKYTKKAQRITENSSVVLYRVF